MKTRQRHVTLLKTQDGDVPTTRNILVNYLHCPLTHINVQVIYTSIQNNLSLQEHPYSIHFLQSSLRILKFGYTASKIVITSSPSSVALILCITPFSSQSLTTYGRPVTISESSAGIMNHTINGYIDTFLIRTLDHGCATNTTQTHQHVSPG